MSYAGFKVVKIGGVNYRKYPSGTIKYIAPMKSKHSQYLKEPAIYQVTDKTTGRLYIGSTVNMRKRMRHYEGKDLSKHVFMELTFNDLEITVLEYCKGLTVNDRLLKEYQYIIELNTIYPDGNNMQCPVTKVKFSLLDMNSYNPLTYQPIIRDSVYDKKSYQRNKERISAQRKARRIAKGRTDTQQDANRP